jgi:hypothetical protein
MPSQLRFDFQSDILLQNPPSGFLIWLHRPGAIRKRENARLQEPESSVTQLDCYFLYSLS